MKKELFRFTLYVIIVYLTNGTLSPAIAATQPSGGNGTHFCGVSHYQPRWYRDSKQQDNRNYARRFAANLNVGGPRTVRLIYFLPNDRPYRAKVVQKMKDDILKIQTFFAEQMEAHGYGKLTFRVETDAQGKPIVHRVNARHPDSHYLDTTEEIVIGEIEQTFNFHTTNHYLVVVDNSINALGGEYGGQIGGEAGGVEDKAWGYGIVDGGYNWREAAHELGHAFGLWHDFRDDAYLMSWGPGQNRLSACHAAFLAVHPYFNPNIPVEEGPRPTIELISPHTYPVGSQSIPVRLKISDSGGLHWVILFIDGDATKAPEVKACHGLAGKKEAVIEFDYDGVIPSNGSTNLSSPLVHPIRVEAIDTDGDVGRARFVLFSETLQPLSKISGDNQHGLPNTRLPVPFVVEARDLNNGFVRNGVPVTFTVTAGGGMLSTTRTTTDRNGRAESTLTLGPNLGTNTVEVSAGGIGQTVSFNAVADVPVDIPDPNLRAAIETTLGKAPGTPIAPAEMANLTLLEARNANISDLTGLEGATNLRTLYLWNNSISDISVVAGLTNLIALHLGNNSVSDISAVAGLTNLTSLHLGNNSVSDISAVAGLTNLTELYLWNNSISNISVVAGLTNLIALHLGNNSVSDISAVAGLTNLTSLRLGNNSVSDISAVAGLTNLTELYLWNNSISNISVVAGLTNLIALHLGNNSVSDISAVAGLTNLTSLWLQENNISDISPLVANAGLGSGDTVNVRRNSLSYQSIHTHIPTLQQRGVTVEFNNRTPAPPLKISGDDQQAAPGTTLEHPFVVEVRDQNGEVFAGVPVTFAITAGGGTLSVTNTIADANGRAQSILTLGPNPETNTISVSATRIAGSVTFHAISDIPFIEYILSIPAGTSLIHVPLRVTAVDKIEKIIESVGDLYDALGGASVVNFLITYDSATQGWLSYFVPSDKGSSADAALTDDKGIIVGLRTPVSIQLRGNPLGTDGNSAITLTPGINLVGLPLRDSRVRRVSDLLALNGIGGNVPVIILTDNGDFKAVGRAGDPGDIPITGGQAFILTAQQAAQVTIAGQGWTNVSGVAAAPLVAEVTDTTPVLALRGAVVDERTGAHGEGFRVTVKNLSIGKAITGLTTGEAAGYRLTVVDTEMARAAMTGDVLEVSARSANPQIGVKPLRYTVTADDVRRSLIELPELVIYEIPAETKLLANYPNPFNPETWIPYRLASDGYVTLTIYDLSGRVVRTLDVGHRVAAVYESRSKAIYFDSRNQFGETVASGVYFYHLLAGDYSATQRMLIVK